MKKFVYKALDSDSNIVKSELEELDRDIAVENLKNQDLKIIYIKEKFDISKIDFLKRNLSEEDLANFCGQTAMIISSGLNLLIGLETIKDQSKNKEMSKLINEIILGIKKGNNLAASMKACGEFPSLLTDMIMIGEISGNVETILYNMEEFYNRESNIKNKIKSASIYPILIFSVAIGMMLFFNFFIFPEIKDLFLDMNLPTITVFILGFMNFLNKNYIIVLVFLLILIIFVKYVKKIPEIKYIYDKYLLNIPIIGLVVSNIITSRFTRSMGIFLKSAVPIMTIMDNIKLIVGNEFIAKKIDFAKNEIISGTKFADSIGNEKIFDSLVIQMIRVGEETGQLDDMMFKLADIYDTRVERGINRLMSLVEPVLTLVIGIVVGVVIISVALPIMQMTESMK